MMAVVLLRLEHVQLVARRTFVGGRGPVKLVIELTALKVERLSNVTTVDSSRWDSILHRRHEAHARFLISYHGIQV